MKRLIIADDNETNRELLCNLFVNQFEIYEACDGEQVIELVEKYDAKIDMILLDLQMPKKTGLDVLKYLNEQKLSDKIPVIMITGESTVDCDVDAYDLGVADIIYKPFSARIVLKRVANIIELFENRANMEQMLAKRTKQLQISQEKLQKNNDFLIGALSSMLEIRCKESGEHIQRVKPFTNILLHYIAKYYPEYELTERQIEVITKASVLHDIGKIAIPDSILMKPGRLSREEYETMKTHAVRGCEILESFKQEDSEFYRYCFDICRYHHERYDGMGYPEGLAGEEIPIWAQVVALADVFDALVSERVYKPACTVEEAENMIMEGECGVFSPKLLDCFQRAKKELYELVDYSVSLAIS